ncbi:hypothetical protein ACLK17_24695 [Escherichia coli]
MEVVFLATAHEVSHDLAPQFLEAGCVVFDLSGVFRVNDPTSMKNITALPMDTRKAGTGSLGLAEWCGNKLKEANLIAVRGCYPTAAQLALKPLIDADLLDLDQWPVMNAPAA